MPKRSIDLTEKEKTSRLEIGNEYEPNPTLPPSPLSSKRGRREVLNIFGGFAVFVLLFFLYVPHRVGS